MTQMLELPDGHYKVIFITAFQMFKKISREREEIKNSKQTYRGEKTAIFLKY